MPQKKTKKITALQEIEFFFLGIYKHRSHCKGKDWRGFYKRNQEKCKLKDVIKPGEIDNILTTNQ